MTSDVFDDGKFVIVEVESPIFYISENDSFYEKENFEIEVFHIENDTLANNQEIEKMVPLLFKRNRSNVINGVYHEVSPGYSEALGFDLDWEVEMRETIGDKEVEFYFAISTDLGIPYEEICKNVDKINIKNQFLDEIIKCPDVRTDRFDLYSTDVTPEDIEDCD